MGFGGGSTGAFSLPNHLHTNALQDGGDLERLVTLVDGNAFPTFSTQDIRPTTSFTTTSATLVDATGWTLTTANRVNVKSLISCILSFGTSAASQLMYAAWNVDGVVEKALQFYSSIATATGTYCVTMPLAVEIQNKVCKIQVGVSGGVTLTLFGSTVGYYSSISALEVS